MENNVDNELTIDIGDILRSLYNFKTIRNIVFVGIICGIIAFSYSRFCIPDQFTSQVAMYVNNNNMATLGEKVEINDINASQKIVESCIVILKDNIVMELISDNLIRDYEIDKLSEVFEIRKDEEGKKFISTSEISNSISLTNVNETEVLNITVTTKSPEISLSICEYMMSIAPDMVKRVINGGAIEPIGEPRLPTTKSSPNNIKNGIVGGFVGGFFILAYYVLKILLDTKIKNTEDFYQRFEVPVLAEIPLFVENKSNSDSQKNKSKNTDLVFEDSFSVVESYNSFASNILFSCRATESKVVLISSADSNDGKTTTALKVSEALNNIVGKVLLIDCDLRKSTIHKKYNLSNKKGVSTIVSGISNLEETIIKTEGLPDIITSGPVSPNTAEILASKYMDELIDNCCKLYDFIIIDTAPLNLVNDACILSKHSRGIIFVARAEKTLYKDVERVSRNLQLIDSKIAGVVINGVEAEKSYYSKYSYYKNYKYGYRYDNKVNT